MLASVPELRDDRHDILAARFLHRRPGDAQRANRVARAIEQRHGDAIDAHHHFLVVDRIEPLADAIDLVAELCRIDDRVAGERGERVGVDLFAYMERDREPAPGTPISDLTWRWWEMMAPYMETNSDFSPVQRPVEEMFNFENR